MLAIDFKGNKLAISRQGPRQPDRRVSAQSADFQDMLGPCQLREQHQHFALYGRNIDWRQVVFAVVQQCFRQRGISLQ